METQAKKTVFKAQVILAFLGIFAVSVIGFTVGPVVAEATPTLPGLPTLQEPTLPELPELPEETLPVLAKSLDSYSCNETEWHFAITGIGGGVEAPAEIEVVWSDGAGTVALEGVTGGIAHYRTTGHLNAEVVSALAVIDADWDGQFNVSHGPCEGGDDEEVYGSITICKAIIDDEGTIIDGAGLSGTFSIAGIDMDDAAGVLPTSEFSAPLSFNTTVFGEEVDAECVTYDDLVIGLYYYDEEVITGDDWYSPMYNDQYEVDVVDIDDFFTYDNAVFNDNDADDDGRNLNADGQILLTVERPDRTLIVLNGHDVDDTPEYAPYCGDGLVNQSWESCDGGEQCTAQCQNANQCVDASFARINVNDVENWGAGNATSDVFLGSADNKIPAGAWFLLSQGGVAVVDGDMTSEGYENVPGIAVERAVEGIRTLLFGSQTQNDKEHVDGNVEFFNASVTGVLNDTSGNNHLENGFDGNVSLSPGQDEVWTEGSDDTKSHFWLTVDVADDGFYTTYNDESPYCGVTIVAIKVMCESEDLLPNWSGGADISSTTAKDFVDATDGCEFVPNWDFQYADGSAANPGDNLGEAGEPWTTFEHKVWGVSVTQIDDISDYSKIWVREVMQPGYVPFTYATTNSNVSAEMYCHTDVLNYDNYDYIDSPIAGETYYCVALNAPEDVHVNQPPVITLRGDNPVNLYVGATYIEEEADVDDLEDGDIDYKLVIAGDVVDTSSVGTYLVTYNATDTEGLAAEEVTRTVYVTEEPTGPTGSITVCKVVVIDGEVTHGTNLPEETLFTIPGKEVVDANALPETDFSLPLTFNADLLTEVQGDDAECVTYNNLEIGSYYYDHEEILGTGNWEEPKYNDGLLGAPTTLGQFYAYVDGNDPHILADGHILLTEENPNRTLTVLNTYTSGPTPYAPYCGDGVVNQEWEVCDGGESCTAQCQDNNQCVDLAFARINVEEEPKNYSNGDMTSDIFLGSEANKIPAGAWFLIFDGENYVSDADVSGYEDVPGLAVERQEGSVRVLAYGSHGPDGSKEHINGNVEFFNFTVEEPTNDPSGNNSLENGFDTLREELPGQDEVWLEDENNTQTFFWLTVTGADDAFFSNYGGEEPICEDPNTPPTITITGDNPAYVPLFGTYSDEGATATDAEDDDTVLTSQIVKGGSVDTSTVGTYFITYDVTDSGGLSAETATRTVHVVDDNEPPVCSDQVDNDNDGKTDAEDEGCWSNPTDPETYNPNDDDENAKPVITLTGSAVIQINKGETYNDKGATANDDEDGDITDDIVTVGTSTIDTFTPGTYFVTYNVTDSDGLAADEVTRKVKVVDPSSNPSCETNCGGGGGGGGPIPNNLKIFDEKIEVIGEGQALITWKTNKPADSRVVYDDDSHELDAATLNFGTGSQNLDYEFTTNTDAGLKTEHSVLVTNVNLEDIFYFRPISSDGTRAIGIELQAKLGVVTIKACNQYLYEFIKFGESNNSEEVRKLQVFLNEFEGENLEVSGVYNQATFDAVVRFQNKYSGDVLSPWGLQTDTGYVYLTTRKKINEIYCNFELEFPLSAEQLAEVNEFKSLLEQLQATGQPLPDTSNVGVAPTQSTPTFAVDTEDDTPNVTLVEETTGEGEGEEGDDQLATALEAVEGDNGEGFFTRIGNFFKGLFR